MIRVMVVDDADIVRRLLVRVIGKETDMTICAEAGNGQDAITAYRRENPDIVLMDVEMPHMNGIEALRQIIDYDPKAQVIMCSALTNAGGQVTMDALRYGAIDYVLKAGGSDSEAQGAAFIQNLLKKIRSAGHKKAAIAAGMKGAGAQGNIKLRAVPPSFKRADMIMIGSSTGGVEALFAFFAGLGPDFPDVPILITQHMPAAFSGVLAGNLAQRTHLPVHEAAEGMAVEKNHVYVAGGDRHMVLRRNKGWLCLHQSDAPPENFCRPAVDPMIRSALEYNAGSLMVVMLTGIGHDGLAGARMAVDAGHMLVAQDEASSVVWGMPGAVALAGLCHAVLPLTDIGGYVRSYL